MSLTALLHEIEELRRVCLRLDGLGERFPQVSEQLSAICGHIRGSAALLEVLVTIKLDSRFDGA